MVFSSEPNSRSRLPGYAINIIYVHAKTFNTFVEPSRNSTSINILAIQNKLVCFSIILHLIYGFMYKAI